MEENALELAKMAREAEARVFANMASKQEGLDFMSTDVTMNLSPELASHLLHHFGEIVRLQHQACLRPMNASGYRAKEVTAAIGLEFIDYRPGSSTTICHLTIDYPGVEISFSEMSDIMADLEQFCTYEAPAYAPPRKIAAGDNRRWSLGDGDDPGAVFFRNGKICIWLRGWPV